MEATSSTDVARFRTGRKASDPQAAAYRVAGGKELGPGTYVLYWLWSGSGVA